jgi:hypothetical protein
VGDWWRWCGTISTSVLLGGCAPGGSPDDVGAVSPPVEETAVVSCSTAPDEPARFEPAAFGPDWEAQVPGTVDAPSGWGASVADFNGDGRLDVFLPQRGRDALYLQGEDGLLVDVSADRLPDAGEDPAIGSAAADFDGDGDLDLVVVGEGTGGALLLNKSGVFHDTTDWSGVPRARLQGYSAAWGDLEGDGDLDLFVARMGLLFDPEVTDPPPAYNALFENLGDGTFADVSDRLVGPGNGEYTFLGSWLDVDDDLDQDLFLVSDKGHLGFGNGLLLNDGTGHFTDVTEPSGLGVPMIGAMGLGIGDLNEDTRPDLLVTDWGRLWMFESHEPQLWYESGAARNICNDADAGQIVAWGAELEDLDSDGDLDAVVSYGTDEIVTVDGPPHGGFIPPEREPASVMLQGSDGLFGEVATDWGIAEPIVGRGIVVADFDGDGQLDLLRRDVWGAALASRHAGEGGSWLSVTLSAPGLNRFGIGARVEVERAGRTQSRWVHAGGTSLASSGPPAVHFGLGDDGAVDAVRVYWPDGTVQIVEDVTGCTALTVARD